MNRMRIFTYSENFNWKNRILLTKYFILDVFVYFFKFPQNFLQISYRYIKILIANVQLLKYNDATVYNLILIYFILFLFFNCIIFQYLYNSELSSVENYYYNLSNFNMFNIFPVLAQWNALFQIQIALFQKTNISRSQLLKFKHELRLIRHKIRIKYTNFDKLELVSNVSINLRRNEVPKFGFNLLTKE